MNDQQPSLPDNYDDWCWYRQGTKQNNEKKYEQAIASFERAIQQDSNAYGTWYCKGNALFYLKRYEEAINCYEQAASINPNSYIAWESRGLALYALELYEAAISSLNRALEIQPNNYGTSWAKGNALYRLGRIEEAVEDYHKALTVKPDAQEVWTLQGKALSDLKRYEQAVNSYEKALAIQPEVGDRRGEVNTLLSLIPLYIFNGRIQDSFLAQKQTIEIGTELYLSPDDPLYPLTSNVAKIPPETFPALMSLSNRMDEMGWIGRLIGFATKGKVQSGLSFVVWLLFATAFVALLPITFGWWLIKKLVRRT